ncbi:protein-glutamate methylesterase/protein-glutamine glutaminase [Tepidibacter formicigenes]|jgi:two-component system chemotaxis response regulator CheB|uniref:Protein-glutamate methylesterase/protein-glutamine glutaminase n=1 Tax=Tepidibacter formicigenes DSM 15518 TaxID=1123349 RepID=A0A1M6JAU6_9FIRM|nr:chemotaxis response regulator protein-glutamate methylesterase [Tepidibacter formicigenes]SHJ43815.1 two-component system, chemotaxis family, response regulator CheB [Tepidibacter formicigenes DSM 15518]
MDKIKVLIVDDSAFIRKIIRDILSADRQIQVVDVAKNGKEAIEKLMTNEVDVITLDVEMPIMNGILTLEKIMNQKPTPVVMLSSLTKSGADLTIQALNLGAVDFITKPSNIFKINDEEIKSLITDKIKIASRVKVSKKPYTVEKKIKKINKENLNKKDINIRSDTVEYIIAIGTSTGGPRALQEVVTNISKNINAPIVIVQHMPPGFTKSLAERLNNISQIFVKEAEDGEIIKNGVAYIAPGDRHIKFKNEGKRIKIVLDDGQKVSSHKPSVDAMFYSLCEIDLKKMIAVVMTGMGSDGTKGLKKLKEMKSNVISIAEDESTCVVFGMPKSVINLGLADKVLPVNFISKEINKLMGV